ncbi:polygalacturonase inhibitor-like [Iris pallida]|uniref:Polygalacturonase inhibitor-like n=1 Tax=Iris pallida TaxID=29817 RepID=A0AAX6G7Q3_IRIPA|nr:polygalacturonase inhibitor-like [Iris pallida]
MHPPPSIFFASIHKMANAVIIAIIPLFLAFTSAYTSCNKQDHAALLAFARSFPHNNLLDFWTNATDCCNWDYLRCDDTTGRVTDLEFSGFSDDPPAIAFNGSIPASIGDLSALEGVSFAQMPGLVGALPSQLTKLKKLKLLSVQNTQISGTIPSFFSRLPSLEQLDLYKTSLSEPSLPLSATSSTSAPFRCTGTSSPGPYRHLSSAGSPRVRS